MGERIVIIGKPEGHAQALGEALSMNGLSLDYLDEADTLGQIEPFLYRTREAVELRRSVAGALALFEKPMGLGCREPEALLQKPLHDLALLLVERVVDRCRFDEQRRGSDPERRLVLLRFFRGSPEPQKLA